MQPLFGGDADYQAKYTGPIEQIFQTHQPHLPWGGDFPEEAKQFFSSAFLWSPKETEVYGNSRFCTVQRLSSR
nr:hypothetical protein [Microcoleus asticus]